MYCYDLLGRPGSATSAPFSQTRVTGGGGIKYGGVGSGGTQSQQQSLPEHLVSAAAAAAAAAAGGGSGAYPHRPSSSLSTSLRTSSTVCSASGYSTLSNSSQFHPASAAVAAAASHLGHGESLQDLVRYPKPFICAVFEPFVPYP